jgi:hypothetical protein
VVLKEIEVVVMVEIKEVDLVTKDKGIKEEEISTIIKKIRFFDKNNPYINIKNFNSLLVIG